MTVVLDARNASSSYQDELPLSVYADTPSSGADLLIGVPVDSDAQAVALAEDPTLTDAVLRRYGGNRSDSSAFQAERDPVTAASSREIAHYELRIAKPFNTYRVAGSHVAFVAPYVGFGGAAPPRPATGEDWFEPTGQIIVLPPTEVEEFRTDRVTPAFSAQQLWILGQARPISWVGTEPTTEFQEQRNLFIAGLLFGVAGSGIIAMIQELAAARRRRRERGLPT